MTGVIYYYYYNAFITRHTSGLKNLLGGADKHSVQNSVNIKISKLCAAAKNITKIIVKYQQYKLKSCKRISKTRVASVNL